MFVTISLGLGQAGFISTPLCALKHQTRMKKRVSFEFLSVESFRYILIHFDGKHSQKILSHKVSPLRITVKTNYDSKPPRGKHYKPFYGRN